MNTYGYCDWQAKRDCSSSSQSRTDGLKISFLFIIVTPAANENLVRQEHKDQLIDQPEVGHWPTRSQSLSPHVRRAYKDTTMSYREGPIENA